MTRYQYTGQFSYAAEFGLYFYNARWYDPALARFTSADTIIPEQTQGTQAWDRYAYVSNNPIRSIDPTGHIGEDCRENPETCKAIPAPTPSVPPLPPSEETPIPPTTTPTPPTTSATPSPPQQVCSTPMLGAQNCTDSQDPGFSFTIGFKDWEDIDKIDLLVDTMGIIGDIALFAGGPPGAVIWLFSEIPEFLTIGKSYDQLEASNPDPTGIMVDTGIDIAQGTRLIPAFGWIPNVAGIALNIFTIRTVP